MPDLYSTLGVPRGAGKTEIKKAYRKLAAKLHPDKSPGAANEARFKEVTRAYEVLGDEGKRKLYDEFGDVSLQSGFDPERARAMRNFGGFSGARGPSGGVSFDLGDLFGGGGLGDTFGDLFGRARKGHAGPRRGPDVVSSVRIPFADAVRGTTLKLSEREGGEVITVRIPAGADDGSRLRVRGKGGVNGGVAGDLVLTLEVEPHSSFTREGDDLHVEVPITVAEAYRGAQVQVPTPHGDVKLSVPKRAQSGQKVRLRGKGVTRKGKPAGDLYVRFFVMVPKDASDEVERAVDVIASHTDEPRRDLRF